MRLALIVTSVAGMDPTWTTIHLIHAAVAAGHTVRLAEPQDFEVTAAGRLVMRAWCLDHPIVDRIELTRRITHSELPRRYVDVGGCDRLLIRVNPLSADLVHYALLAQDAGVTVINDPMGLMRTRSKSWLATLTDVPRPSTLVSTSKASIQAFAQNLGRKVVVKPVNASGGRGVALVSPMEPERLEEAVDQARAHAHGGPVVVQEYLEEAPQGEKRLFWVDGALLGAYLRRPAEGEFRHNLKQGALPHATQIDAADRRIATALSPHLLRAGIRIAGLDVIGGRLVEVNTLNPGGVHWSDALGSAPPGAMAAQAILLLTGPAPISEAPRPCP
jgi:glutathione synthase